MSAEDSQPLRNRQRADAVMDRLGFEALVALQPHHVLYLTDHAPRTLNVRWDVGYAAVLPRAPERPVGLVVQALELLFLAGRTLPVDQIEAYLAPLPDAAAIETDEPPALGFPGFAQRPGAELTPGVQAKLAISQARGTQAAATAAHALGRLIRAAGLERARVVTDDARTAGWLAQAGLRRIECVYDPAVFKEIRIVKTPAEIARLRIAARNNEAACRAVAHAARPGMTAEELELAFVSECARLGSWAAYLVSDIGDLPHGRVVPGEPLMLDALSQRQGYYGDFGRTLVVGEVSRELQRRALGLDAAWAAAREALRPGADYESVRRAAVRGARDAGFGELQLPVAHCVGLQHTDDPVAPGLHTGINPNRVLEPGMVLNLDMPFIEWGWGALHREDTVLVTERGCELLTDADASLIVV